jgi:hypothetical protein
MLAAVPSTAGSAAVVASTAAVWLLVVSAVCVMQVSSEQERWNTIRGKLVTATHPGDWCPPWRCCAVDATLKACTSTGQAAGRCITCASSCPIMPSGEGATADRSGCCR